MLKVSALRLSALLAAYSVASYSSDAIYGYTPNVAAGGSSWSMSESVLGVAPVPGLDISGVIYRYTAVKERPDDFTVTVSNQNAVDGGYIFRETDDWSGKSGQTINKLVPVGYSPIRYWGDGSIETTGVGSVVDPSVVYMYRFQEPEPEVQTPTLPTINPYNALEDDAVQRATAETDRELYEDDEIEKDKDEEEEKDMEKALAALQSGLEMAKGQDGRLAQMNPLTLTQYYAVTIPGGAYKETVMLDGGEIKDNKRAFRSMANDKLHTKMVEEQYQ
jgi:hypothetical protein